MATGFCDPAFWSASEPAGVRPNIKFKHFGKFTEAYGQELGFSPAQAAIRAGHDPSVAARHYTGRFRCPTTPDYR